MQKRRIFRRNAIALATVLAGCLIAPFGAAAADLNVHYSILQSETKGNSVHGVIEVRIVNTSGQTIHNVDLRLAPGGGNSIEKNLFQFGTIPSHQGRVAVGHFVFSGASKSDKPILWKIDFDDSSRRNHKQIVASGNEEKKGGKK